MRPGGGGAGRSPLEAGGEGGEEGEEEEGRKRKRNRKQSPERLGLGFFYLPWRFPS